MTDTPASVMDRFFSGYASGDIEAVAALFHPEAVVHESDALPFGGEYHGRDGFRKLIGAMLSDFQFEAFDPEYLPVDDHRIVVRVRARFTLRSSGAAVEFPVLEIYSMQDGMIRDVDVYYKDPGAVANLLAQGTV
jgi:ketosteroid isomerase-like protein